MAATQTNDDARKKEILSKFKKLLVKAARKERLKKLIEIKRKEQGIDVHETENSNDSPFVPCSDDCIEQFMHIAHPNANDIIVDLGCGDARVLIAAAKRTQCKCIGIEIQPEVAKKAKQNVMKNNLSHLIQIIECDFKSQQCGDILRRADIVFIFLLPKILPLVTNILVKYIQHKCRVLSYIFDLAVVKTAINTQIIEINHWLYPTLGCNLEYIENKGVFLRDIHPDLKKKLNIKTGKNDNNEYKLLSVNGKQVMNVTNLYQFMVYKRYLHSVLANYHQYKNDKKRINLVIQVTEWNVNYDGNDLDGVRPAVVCEVTKKFKSGSEIRSDLKLYEFPLKHTDFGWQNPNSASRIVHATN